jgi:hypothetical protein
MQMPRLQQYSAAIQPAAKESPPERQSATGATTTNTRTKSTRKMPTTLPLRRDTSTTPNSTDDETAATEREYRTEIWAGSTIL